MTRRAAFVSKTVAPRRSEGTIRRGSLLAKLGCDESPVNTVIAPAGYGKTTLLIDCANDWPGKVAWLSLDEWDIDPVGFLLYLRAALGAGPPAGSTPPSIDPSPDSLHKALGEIVSHASSADPDTLLILDDFHLVEDSVPVVDLVDYLVRWMPTEISVIIASRHPLPLQSLAKLLLSGRVTEYGPDDLAFDSDEVREICRARGYDPSDLALERILEVTGGWPAGVALTGDPSGVEDEQRRTGVVTEYVTSEVLRDLPDSVRSFLSRTSVLSVLEPDSCDWVLESSGSADVLDLMTKSNIPLTRGGGAGIQLRIHPLVRDLLHARLKAEDPALYRALHLRAAERAEGLGQQSEAVASYIEGEDWAAAARLIAEQAPGFYRLGRWHTIAAWMREFPAERLRDYPALRWWQARILARLGEIDGALRIVADAAAGLDDQVQVSRFGTLRASILRAKGDVSGALAEARQAADLSMASNAPIDVVSEARKELGLALMAQGSALEAVDEFKAVLLLQERSGNTEEAATVNGCLGSALGASGKLTDSTEYLERARQQWQMAGNTNELCWVLNNLGITYQRIGQGEMAAEVLRQCIDRSRECGNRRAEAYGLVSLADIEIQSSDPAEAQEKYQAAHTIATELNDHTALTHARCGLAMSHGQLGEPERGVAIAHQALASAEDRGSLFEEGVALSCLGRLLRQRGDIHDAVTHLSDAVALFDRTSSTVELAQSLLYLSDAALALRGSRSLVRVSLERFVTLAESLGEGVLFLAPMSEVKKVIEYGASKRIGRGLFRELVRRSASSTVREPEATPPRGAGRLPEIRLNALGVFEVEVGGRPVLSFEWESEKAREMFLLLATAEKSFTRDEIVAALWPDAGGPKASSAFHSTLHRVRQATYREAIVASAGRYSLNPEAALKSDVDAFRRGIGEASGGLSDLDRSAVLREALSLYRGSFAPGIVAEWAEAHRRTLEESFLRSSVELAQLLLDHGDYSAAAKCAERILEFDQFSETACLLLMRAQSATGDVESALRSYRRFSETLDLELGEVPADSLTRLQAELRGRVGRT